MILCVKVCRLNATWIFEGTQCSLIATAYGQTIDVAAYQWHGNRSPLTIRRDELPTLFGDVSQRAFDAIDRLLPEYGGRFGSLVTEECAFDREVRERLERRAAGIVEPVVDEDELLVAKNPTLDYRSGVFGGLVAAARYGISQHREAAEKVAAAAADKVRRETVAKLLASPKRP